MIFTRGNLTGGCDAATGDSVVLDLRVDVLA